MGHVVQYADELAPATVEYEPRGHAKQPDRPVALVNKPAAHAVHTADVHAPGVEAYQPAAQAVQAGARRT